MLIFAADMTTLKYVEQPQMGSTEEPKLVTTTVHAYDVCSPFLTSQAWEPKLLRHV
jgi:hypothetical protein